ncbi:hypothetical protein IE53DRAFT_379611 [Violaceomyces palustris]|uniref:Uncharacterized protein n=1 Tax=Violaceomyces palustris TaxID=1673888 RepID=A0ACD0NXT6_9BASI|nr:hypothetical protein IE53DRAFT_379611 [Violaceomyces palustris]
MDFNSIRRRPGAATYGKSQKRQRLGPTTESAPAASSTPDSSPDKVPFSHPRPEKSLSKTEHRASSSSPSKSTSPFRSVITRNSPTLSAPTSGRPPFSSVKSAPSSPQFREGTSRPSSSARSPSKRLPGNRSGSVTTPLGSSPTKRPSRPAENLDQLFESLSPGFEPAADSEDPSSRNTRASNGGVKDGPSDTTPLLPSDLGDLGKCSSVSVEEPAGLRGDDLTPEYTAPQPSKRVRLSDRMARRGAPKRADGSEEGNLHTGYSDDIESRSQGDAGMRTPVLTTGSRQASMERSTQKSETLSAELEEKPNAIRSQPPKSYTSNDSQTSPWLTSRPLLPKPDPGSPTPSEKSSRLASHDLGDGRDENRKPDQVRTLGVAAPLVAGARRTYGSQRSFLAEMSEAEMMKPSAGSDGDQSSNAAATGVSGRLLSPSDADLGLSESIDSISSARQTQLPKFPRPPQVRESYADLRKKWGDQDTDDDEEENSQDAHAALKSITSLRSVGELRRFKDDLEYLFSGLGLDNPLSVRQSSAADFVLRMCGKDTSDDSSALPEDDEYSSSLSTEFLQKLKATDGIVRSWTLLRNARAGEGEDEVLDACMAVFVARLCRNQNFADALLRERSKDVLSCIAFLLERAFHEEELFRKDGFRRLKLLVGKKRLRGNEKLLTESLQKAAGSCSLFLNRPTSMTTGNLVLGSVCSLANFHPRPDLDVRSMLARAPVGRHDKTLLSLVVNICNKETVKIKERMESYEKGLDLMPPTVSDLCPDIDTLDMCVRLLGLTFRDIPTLESDLEQISTQILSIGNFCFVIVSEPERAPESDIRASRALEILVGLSKLLLDLTGYSQSWCSAFLRKDDHCIFAGRLLSKATSKVLQSKNPNRSPLTSEEAEGTALEVDTSQLLLGFLGNLLTKADGEATLMLEKVTIGHVCKKRRSIDDCSCKSHCNLIHLVTEIFLSSKKEAVDHGDGLAACLAGSAALVLAHYGSSSISRLRSLAETLASADAKNPSNRAHDLPSSRRQNAMQVIESIEDFASLHEVINTVPDAAGTTDAFNEPSAGADVNKGAEEAKAMRSIAAKLRSMSDQL